jgi:hypothetical protein
VVGGNPGPLFDPLGELGAGHSGARKIHPSQISRLKRHRSQTGNRIDACVENFGIAVCLSMVPWQSPDDRDVFIMTLTGEDVKGGEPSTFNPGSEMI